MRSPLLIAVIFLAAACRQPGVSGIDSAWRASPERLDFGAVFLTATSERRLTVQNTSLVALELELRVEAPFEAPPSVRVEAGSSLEVPIVFRPLALGAAQGALQLGELQVPLEGRGEATPVCAAPGACETSRFDPVSGACVSEPVPDGTACESACLTGATCLAGTCAGAPKSCDDGNACTLDTCDAERGCSHTDVSESCPASLDRCLRATCSPASGCGLEPVADGTSCGELDCTTAHVCISARCEARPTPDGAECRPAGPCAGPSTCRQNICVAGSTTMLKERWRYTPAGRSVFFEGTVGPDGTAYFTESSLTDPTAALELVARARDGAERFRVELQRPCQRCSARVMLDPVAGRLFAARLGVVQARSLTNGALLWTRDTTAGKTARSPRPDGGVSWSSSALIGVAPDVVVQQLSEGYELHRDYSVALDRATGRVLWEKDFWGHVYSPGATAANQLWITSADCWAPISASQVFDATGALAGTVARQAQPLTFRGDEALLSGSDLAWASAARGVSATMPLTQGAYAYGLTAPGRLVLGDYQSARSFGPDGGVRWSRGFGGYTAAPALLSDGGLLVAAQQNDGGSTLHVLDEAGATSLSCPIAGSVSNATPMGGLWYAQVRNGQQESLVAFEVPVGELEPSGWVTRSGGPSSDRRPR